ncbi:hypothetical protein [Pseudomonas sp. PH1b]|uniref:hypothetical protein n=1 Tax=Pseudomonas sp. PH1b TaxID=1397282 RepID=UPI0009DE8C02|nr:hypothetical protein [Pseudomonas sp. PH1b]BFD44367.1 hypothetical protein FFPRI1PSEUD_58660 [Pseudomonas sp. FFPRI_1]
MKAWLFGLACIAALLLGDRNGAPPVPGDEPPRHWCVHEWHRALGEFFFRLPHEAAPGAADP